MNNPGLNTFNVVKDLTGPTPGVETMQIDDWQVYGITLDDLGDGKFGARTVNHTEPAAGLIDYVGSDNGYEFDFELSSFVVDTDSSRPQGKVKITFYDYNYNAGAGNEQAGPVLDGRIQFTYTGFSDIQFDIKRDRGASTVEDNDCERTVYFYEYGGQRPAIAEMIAQSVSDAVPITVAIQAFTGDDTCGFAIKKV